MGADRLHRLPAVPGDFHPHAQQPEHLDGNLPVELVVLDEQGA